MEVDEPGRDQFAGGVQHLLRARGRNVRLDRLDHAEADADVAPSPQALTWVEDVASFDHQIELVVRPHGGAGPSDPRGSKGSRTGCDQELTACRGHIPLPAWL